MTGFSSLDGFLLIPYCFHLSVIRSGLCVSGVVYESSV